MKTRPRTTIGWLTSTHEGLDLLERMSDKAKEKPATTNDRGVTFGIHPVPLVK